MATSGLNPPAAGDDWTGLTGAPLSGGAALEWAGRPDCGAVVVFSGTVRDHAEGRPGVSGLEYEAYEEHVEPRLERVATEARRRWPDIGRVALLHRTGALAVGECSVLVAVSAPHRQSAFEAARWAIDTVKATVPIWKLEHWEDGEDWATGAQTVEAVDDARPSRDNMAADSAMTTGNPSARAEA